MGAGVPGFLRSEMGLSSSMGSRCSGRSSAGRLSLFMNFSALGWFIFMFRL